MNYFYANRRPVLRNNRQCVFFFLFLKSIVRKTMGLDPLVHWYRWQPSVLVHQVPRGNERVRFFFFLSYFRTANEGFIDDRYWLRYRSNLISTSHQGGYLYNIFGDQETAHDNDFWNHWCFFYVLMSIFEKVKNIGNLSLLEHHCIGVDAIRN